VSVNACAAEDPPIGRGGATRQELLRAAGEQFAASGYRGSSLTGILARAGVTKGALYFHFESKEALAAAVLAESLVRKRRALYGAGGGPDPLRSLLAGLDEVLRLSTRDAVVRGGNRLADDPLMGGQALAHHALVQTAVRERLSAAREAGLVRERVDRDAVARTMTALVTGHLLISARTGTMGDLRARMADSLRVMLPTIATDAWLRANPGYAPPA
jgi:AcrR family transcriptional regulator